MRLAGLERIGVGAALVLIVSGAAREQSTAPANSNDNGEALSEAARRGDVATVKKLLDEGVDVNTKYRYGVTALFYACDRGHVDVVKLLLDRGADVNVSDTFYHATPLRWAVDPPMGRKPQHAEIVGLLLTHGARGKDNALQSAAAASDVPMTRVVLQQGGFSPDTLSGVLELARKNGHQEIAAVLEQAGAKPFVEFKVDPARLERYAGSYRDDRGNQMVLGVKNGRLAASAFGQQFTFIAKDETTFRLLEGPGMLVTFHVQGDKVTGLGMAMPGQSTPITYTRVEGK